MLRYLVRRVAYAIPILLGVLLLTYVVFYRFATPEQMARRNLSAKNPSPKQIKTWITQHGYDKPPLVQLEKHVTELFLLRFGKSDTTNEDIWERIRKGGPISAQIAGLIFLGGVFGAVSFALAAAYYRGTYLDTWITLLCVLLMSVVAMLYIIGLQFVLGKLLKYAPLGGYKGGVDAWRFILLPVIVGIFAGIGASVRLYRTFMLDEINQDYVRTARSKGVGERDVLFRHVLKNAAIPILTTVVSAIPALFLGNLLIESFFGIPGLGGFLYDAITNQDFAVVRAMVFLGTIVTIIGYILTDLSYALVDPRVRLE